MMLQRRPTSMAAALGLFLLSAKAVTGQIYVSIYDNDEEPTPRQDTTSAENNNNRPLTGDDFVVDVCRTDPRFSNLVSALDAVQLSPDLSGPGPFTLIAPTNDAFASVAGTSVDRWLQAPDVWAPQVVDFLTYHVIANEELLSTELTQQPIGMELYTLEGSPVTITGISPFQLNDVTVLETDILAANGVVHAIDESPLLPPSASQDLVQLLRDMPFLSTAVRLFDQAGLLETLQGEGPLTVLAPTNDAFEAVDAATMAAWEADPELLADALLFHVMDGNVLESEFRPGHLLPRWNNDTDSVPLAAVLVGDTLANNGVLHMIDRILEPSAPLPPTVAPVPTSILGILQARGEFTMLLAALQKTGRISDLQNNNYPFTIFAPTDESILRDLPEKFLDDTWKTHLINVLTYHIVRGDVMTTNLTAVGQQLPTLNFNSLTVTNVNPVQLNDAAVTIVEGDIVADNGIIHIVDQMLLPPSATEYVLDLYALFPEFQTVLDKIGACNLTATVSTEGPMTVFSPVDGAFHNFINPNSGYDLADIEMWKQILLYHIVPGELINFAGMVDDLEEQNVTLVDKEGELQLDREYFYKTMLNETTVNETAKLPPALTIEVPTLQGSNLTLSVAPNKVNDANILFEDLLVKNGIVQVIDRVLLPPNVTIQLVLKEDVTTDTPAVETETTTPPATVSRGSDGLD